MTTATNGELPSPRTRRSVVRLIPWRLKGDATTSGEGRRRWDAAIETAGGFIAGASRVSSRLIFVNWAPRDVGVI